VPTRSSPLGIGSSLSSFSVQNADGSSAERVACRSEAERKLPGLAERDAQLAALRSRVNDIEHKMALANKQIVGPKSERMPTLEQEGRSAKADAETRSGTGASRLVH
jgi:hypothetical protein